MQAQRPLYSARRPPSAIVDRGEPPALLSKLLSNPKTVVNFTASKGAKWLPFPDAVSDVK